MLGISQSAKMTEARNLRCRWRKISKEVVVAENNFTKTVFRTRNRSCVEPNSIAATAPVVARSWVSVTGAPFSGTRVIVVIETAPASCAVNSSACSSALQRPRSWTERLRENTTQRKSIRICFEDCKENTGGKEKKLRKKTYNVQLRRRHCNTPGFTPACSARYTIRRFTEACGWKYVQRREPGNGA